MADAKPPFELPGIQISRIETLDFGSDGRASICSGSTRSRGQFVGYGWVRDRTGR